MKKMLSLFLAILFVFSVLTVTASAETQDIHVYDLLKYDADAATRVCRTVGIYFELQYVNMDDSKTITFQTSDGSIAADCVPKPDNNRILDLYTPDGTFGVRIDPTKLYYLVIPEGTYYTEDGILNAEYRGEYSGIYLSNTGAQYTARDLGISNFLSGRMADDKLYDGRLLVSSVFKSLISGQNSVRLYRINGKKESLVGTYTVTAYKSGKADIDFGGVQIDRWAQYKLHVQYGTFLADGKVVNDHSDFKLSGKKLLGLSENYPAIDMLIELFGADHWTLKAFTTVLKLLSIVQLVDKALYNDIDKYIKARKQK